jgi:hypothetical protein
MLEADSLSPWLADPQKLEGPGGGRLQGGTRKFGGNAEAAGREIECDL